MSVDVLVRQLQGLVVQLQASVTAVQNLITTIIGGDRIVRGTVSGAGVVEQGTGFTASRTAVGTYTITFSPTFAGTPSVTATAESWFARLNSAVPVSAANFGLFVTDNTAAQSDQRFNFVAIGPR